MTNTTALNGLRVLDFTRVLAGPFCTMLLADFGADVIKVERPGLGDDTRQWGPPWAGTGASRLSAYFISANRNKRSLTLDLKSAEGRDIARQLALKSDVVIENFKVGQMRDYGLDYETLNKAHPGLVYCSITGYGQTGPYQQRPGYDYVIQGQSGLMSITGEPGGIPYKVGVAISDVVTGLLAANAIQIALRHRDQTGSGQYVDIALLDAQITALVNVMSNYLISREPPQRYGNAHPNIVPYEAFVTHDGALILAVGNDRQFKQLCSVIERPDLATDARFATNPARVAHRDELITTIEPILRERTTEDWVAVLLAAGVPAGAINDIPAVVADPQVQSRHLVQTVELDDGTSIDLLGQAARLSATPAAIMRPPPELGQHTDEILREMLQVDATTLQTYREHGII